MSYAGRGGTIRILLPTIITLLESFTGCCQITHIHPN